MRTGVLAKKLGMTQIFTRFGERVPVTVLDMSDCVVSAQRTQEKDGYSAVQVAAGVMKAGRVGKARRGQFARAGIEPRRHSVEFRVNEDALLEPGAEISAKHFTPGQFVDVSGVSIGKGFAGGMKRHGFGGLEATHGVSISHRSHGSTGQCQDPGKVFKGKKMAGHLGAVKRTQQNLEIMDIDVERGLLLIVGSVPGPKGGYVTVSDAVKRSLPPSAPYPAALREQPEDAVAEDAEAAENVTDNAENTEK